LPGAFLKLVQSGKTIQYVFILGYSIKCYVIVCFIYSCGAYA